MKNKILTTVFAFVLSTIIFSSCKKKDDATLDFIITYLVNSVREDMDDALKVSEAAISRNEQLWTYWMLVGWATVNFDGTNKKITMDFGTTGCIENDGRLRQGKLYVT